MERRQTGQVQVLIGLLAASFTITSGVVAALIQNERRLTQNEVKLEILIQQVKDIKDTISKAR